MLEVRCAVRAEQGPPFESSAVRLGYARDQVCAGGRWFNEEGTAVVSASSLACASLLCLMQSAKYGRKPSS